MSPRRSSSPSSSCEPMSASKRRNSAFSDAMSSRWGAPPAAASLDTCDVTQPLAHEREVTRGEGRGHVRDCGALERWLNVE